MVQIAVIGAGMAGLTAANMLSPYANITVFEKSRGVSGRLSTRHHDDCYFDHGAPYFSPQSDSFNDFLSPMIEQGIITTWCPHASPEQTQHPTKQTHHSKESCYVGIPGMNAIGKYLSANLKVILNTKIDTIKKCANGWTLQSDKNTHEQVFDWVMIAIPAPQAICLLPQHAKISQEIRDVTMTGCHSLMIGLEQPIPIPFDIAHIAKRDIAWIGINSVKPGRRQHPQTLVIHSSTNWAEQHMDENEDDTVNHLCQQTSDIINHKLNKTIYKRLHRWRYSHTKQNSGKSHHIDPEEKLALCGDWCLAGNVEAAFQSGRSLAQTIIQHI